MRRFEASKHRGWLGLWASGVLVVAFSAAASAEPVYLVDTGPGGASGGRSLTTSQFLAGQFTLDAGSEINALEGWMIYPAFGIFPVHAVLYGDAGGVPDTGNVLFTQLFFIPAGFTPNWYGVDGMALTLEGGTYWLAFEPDPDAVGSGAMPPTPLQELDRYAIDMGTGWVADTTSLLGIRVLPEPGLATMLVSGSVALVGWRRARPRGAGG